MRFFLRELLWFMSPRHICSSDCAPPTEEAEPAGELLLNEICNSCLSVSCSYGRGEKRRASDWILICWLPCLFLGREILVLLVFSNSVHFQDVCERTERGFLFRPSVFRSSFGCVRSDPESHLLRSFSMSARVNLILRPHHSRSEMSDEFPLVRSVSRCQFGFDLRHWGSLRSRWVSKWDRCT